MPSKGYNRIECVRFRLVMPLSEVCFSEREKTCVTLVAWEVASAADLNSARI